MHDVTSIDTTVWLCFSVVSARSQQADHVLALLLRAFCFTVFSLKRNRIIRRFSEMTHIWSGWISGKLLVPARTLRYEIWNSQWFYSLQHVSSTNWAFKIIISPQLSPVFHVVKLVLRFSSGWRSFIVARKAHLSQQILVKFAQKQLWQLQWINTGGIGQPAPGRANVACISQQRVAG